MQQQGAPVVNSLPSIDVTGFNGAWSPQILAKIGKLGQGLLNGNIINLDRIPANPQQIVALRQAARGFEQGANQLAKASALTQLIALMSDIFDKLKSLQQKEAQVKTQAAQLGIDRLATDFQQSQPRKATALMKVANKARASKATKAKIKQLVRQQALIMNKGKRGQLSPVQVSQQWEEVQAQIDQLKDSLHQDYVAQIQDVGQLLAQFKNNRKVTDALNQMQQVLNLNQTQLQNPMPISYKPGKSFQRLMQYNADYGKVRIDDYQYPAAKKLKGVKSVYRGTQWDKVFVDPKLHTLPHQAPQFLRRVLLDSDQKIKNNRAHNDKFVQAFQQLADQQQVELGELMVDQAYWRKKKPPKGFVFDQQQGIMTIQAQNPAVANLWPQGISYKVVPTAKQLNARINFLNASHQTASQMRQAYDQDVVQMMKGAQALGFNPHFGAISKNSPSLYIGAFVDPLTGMIRLPPKPQLKNYNPVDRNSMLQFKVLRSMYTWNTNVKAMQQMKTFMQQTQRGWNQALRNKRKNANILQRQRKQYRGIARKIALGQPIYGYSKSHQMYKDMAGVYQNKDATPQQLIVATNNYMSKMAQVYTKGTKDKMAQFPKVKVPLGDISRARNSYLFQQRPFIQNKKWLDRTLKVSQPIGRTKHRIQRDSIYKPLAQQQYQRVAAQLRAGKKGGIFNTLQSMRSQPNYQNYNTQNYLYTANVPSWHQTYSTLQPQQAIKRTKRLFGAFDQNNIREPPRWSSFNDKMNQIQKKKWQSKRDKLRNIIGTARLTDGQLQQFIVDQQYTNAQIAKFNQLMAAYNAQKALPGQIVKGLLGMPNVPTRLKDSWNNSHSQLQDFKSSQFLKDFILMAGNGAGNQDSIASRTRRKNQIYTVNPQQQAVVISQQQLNNLPLSRAQLRARSRIQ